MRIQFDISDNEAERLTPFMFSVKNRNVFAHKALIEWITRQEGNNKRRKSNEKM